MRSNNKDYVCHGFLVNIFTKSLHRGGVIWYSLTPQINAQTYIPCNAFFILVEILIENSNIVGQEQVSKEPTMAKLPNRVHSFCFRVF